MKKIYSKKEPKELLHLVTSVEEIQNPRLDIAPENEFLQLAILKMQKGKTFQPHKHIKHEKVTDIAQESWLFIKAQLNVFFMIWMTKLLMKLY